MALLHHAYTFDPLAFHQKLEAQILVGNQIDLEALLTEANRSVRPASGTNEQILKVIRFDEDWLAASKEEISYLHKWYILALSRVLQVAPSLSNRFSMSFWILEKALPLLGWSNEEVQLLTYGHALHTLVQSYGHPIFNHEFTGVDQYGGWINLEYIERLLDRLSVIKEQTSKPNPAILALLGNLARTTSEPTEDLLSNAYADAVEMLQTAIDRKSALFIVLD